MSGYDTAEWISAANDVVVGLAAAFAAWTGWMALDRWRHQAVWTEDRALARRILVAVEKVDAAFRVVRSPIHWSSEEPDDLSPEPSPSERRRAQEYRYKQRLAVLDPALRELHAEIREAGIVWNLPALELMGEFHELYAQLQQQIFRYIASQDRDPTAGYNFDDAAENVAMRRILQAHSGTRDPDDFRVALDKALENIRQLCKPKLGSGR